MKHFRMIGFVAVLAVALSWGTSQGWRMQPGMMQQGRGPIMMQGGMMYGQGFSQGWLHDELALLLGVTPDEFYTLLQGGKTPLALIEDLGGNLEDIRNQLAQTRNSTIDAALASGTLTQLQAERMKARSEAVVTALLGHTAVVTSTMPCPFHTQMMFGPNWR